MSSASPLRLAPLVAVCILLFASTVQAAPSDDEIARRVRTALAAIEDVTHVNVEVKAGVVVLTGTTASAAASERAEAVVSKIDGVIGVENGLKRATRVSDRVGPALQRIRELTGETLAWLPLLGVALIILLLAWFVARLVGAWTWLYSKLTRNRFARDLIRQVVRTTIFLGGVLLALEVLDATALVGAVLGTAGIVGLAIGFAFRDLFENYLASILLSVRRPFGPGDHVLIGDDEGKVVSLTTRATILRTLDGNHLRILNADVYKSRILNYSRNVLRRFDFTIGVGVDEDLVAAQEMGRQTLNEMKGIERDPGPAVVIEELGESSVQLRHYGWVDQSEADFSKVRGEAIRRVKLTFEEYGFDMPEPIQRIRVERWQPSARPVTPPPAEALTKETDITPDRHLDEAIKKERASAGDDDLLDEAAASELTGAVD